MMAFSLLMSIYHKEKPNYFHRCMQSIWDEQVVKPNEIILVQDGKLTGELYRAIDIWHKKLGDTLQIIKIEENVGLGKALEVGLDSCSYELVARMDTDDIATPDRFEKQLKVFENSDIDICSAWVSEFESAENNIVSYRRLPERHQDLMRFAKKRNPLNHPVAMYRKSAVLMVGGYKDMAWFEDYYLWARMMLEGAKFYNVQEVLVNMRAGYAQLERRGGIEYAKSEVALQKKFLKLGFINHFEFMQNIAIRITARLMPKYILKKIYSKIRTK